MADLGVSRIMLQVMLNAWTPEEDERLRSLVQKGASPLRAAAVLKRRRAAVIARGRKLGCPFPTATAVRKRMAKSPNNPWREHELYQSPSYR